MVKWNAYLIREINEPKWLGGGKSLRSSSCWPYSAIFQTASTASGSDGSTSPAKRLDLCGCCFARGSAEKGIAAACSAHVKAAIFRNESNGRKESNHSALGQTWNSWARGLVTNGHSHTTQTHWEGFFFFSQQCSFRKLAENYLTESFLPVNIILSKRFNSVYVNYKGKKIIAEIFLKWFRAYFSIVILVFIFSHFRRGRAGE